MRIATKLLTTALGGVFLAGMAPNAFAGCVGGVTGGCAPGVNVHPGTMQSPQAVDVYSSNPYGYLKTYGYKGTPNVNITRVYGQRPSASLNDFPSQFSKGCQPGSTMYCRAPQAQPVQVQMHAPAMPAPAPIIAAPMPAPRVTVGSGYNAANFSSRQYGSTELVRGIAHVPTSIVDRSPITHIDGIPQPHVASVTTAGSNFVSNSINPELVNPGIAGVSSMPRPMGGNVIGHVSGGSYTYQPQGGGQYWEKTSGPTIVDGLPATQILCRREAPRPAPVTVNVTRPVIGVPHPVPTAVPVRVPQCAPAPMMARPMAKAHHGNSRYGSRWTY